MAITLTWILFVFSILTIVVSFIMSPDSNSYSGALVGSSDLDLFKSSKERGYKKALKYTMFALGFLLLIITIIIRAVMQ